MVIMTERIIQPEALSYQSDEALQARMVAAIVRGGPALNPDTSVEITQAEAHYIEARDHIRFRSGLLTTVAQSESQTHWQNRPEQSFDDQYQSWRNGVVRNMQSLSAEKMQAIIQYFSIAATPDGVDQLYNQFCYRLTTQNNRVAVDPQVFIEHCMDRMGADFHRHRETVLWVATELYGPNQAGQIVSQAAEVTYRLRHLRDQQTGRNRYLQTLVEENQLYTAQPQQMSTQSRALCSTLYAAWQQLDRQHGQVTLPTITQRPDPPPTPEPTPDHERQLMKGETQWISERGPQEQPNPDTFFATSSGRLRLPQENGNEPAQKSLARRMLAASGNTSPDETEINRVAEKITTTAGSLQELKNDQTCPLGEVTIVSRGVGSEKLAAIATTMVTHELTDRLRSHFSDDRTKSLTEDTIRSMIWETSQKLIPYFQSTFGPITGATIAGTIEIEDHLIAFNLGDTHMYGIRTRPEQVQMNGQQERVPLHLLTPADTSTTKEIINGSAFPSHFYQNEQNLSHAVTYNNPPSQDDIQIYTYHRDDYKGIIFATPGCYRDIKNDPTTQSQLRTMDALFNALVNAGTSRDKAYQTAACWVFYRSNLDSLDLSRAQTKTKDIAHKLHRLKGKHSNMAPSALVTPTRSRQPVAA